ncbi:MAG: hypothetical protein JWQ02_2040 [Capsulimonas sp.]|jgi:hypothetical protein|nr:hypothetical protein [Capsulimonas sp.]
MNSSFRIVSLAAGIALVVFAGGCSSKSGPSTDDLAQQRKDVLGTPPPPGAAEAMAAKMRAQGMANQQQAQQAAQQQAQQAAQQGGKQ